MLLILLTALASAADHTNLEEGIPISITDAMPVGYLAREAQFVGRYEQTAQGEDRLLLEPRFEFGAFRNGQIAIAGPFEAGQGVTEGIRRVRVEGMYALNRERLALPGFAIQGALAIPTTVDRQVPLPTVELLAMKTIPGTTQLHRFYVNGGWTFNPDPAADERAGAYHMAGAYGARITNDLFFLLGASRRQQMQEGLAHDLAEVGLRHQLTPRAVVSVGSGFGLTPDSPRLRPALGVQTAI